MPGSQQSLCSSFGPGDERANDTDDAKDEEQCRVLVVCAGSKTAKGQRMPDTRNDVVHAEQDANDGNCDGSVEKPWVSHDGNVSPFSNRLLMSTC